MVISFVQGVAVPLLDAIVLRNEADFDPLVLETVAAIDDGVNIPNEVDCIPFVFEGVPPIDEGVLRRTEVDRT